MPTVRDNPEEERFEIALDDGTVAGFITYRHRRDLLALLHTEVGSEYEGQGLGTQLVKGALDIARNNGAGVLPFCPFVNNWLKSHTEYIDLVPELYRANFGL
jgi:predicted GNAT family acetyltransferase